MLDADMLRQRVHEAALLQAEIEDFLGERQEEEAEFKAETDQLERDYRTEKKDDIRLAINQQLLELYKKETSMSEELLEKKAELQRKHQGKPYFVQLIAPCIQIIFSFFLFFSCPPVYRDRRCRRTAER